MRILSGILHQHELPHDKPVKGRGNTLADALARPGCDVVHKPVGRPFQPVLHLRGLKASRYAHLEKQVIREPSPKHVLESETFSVDRFSSHEAYGRNGEGVFILDEQGKTQQVGDAFVKSFVTGGGQPVPHRRARHKAVGREHVPDDLIHVVFQNAGAGFQAGKASDAIIDMGFTEVDMVYLTAFCLEAFGDDFQRPADEAVLFWITVDYHHSHKDNFYSILNVCKEINPINFPAL